MYSYFLIILLLFSSAAYMFGSTRAKRVAELHETRNHSLPGYYGLYTAIWAAIPALILYCVWQVVEPSLLTSFVVQALPADIQKLSSAELSLVINDIRNVIEGSFTAGVEEVAIKEAAERYLSLQENFRFAVLAVLFVVMIGSVVPAYRKISPQLRARNIVEKLVKYFLIGCSALAILTTIGILFSVLFEAIRFFKIIGNQSRSGRILRGIWRSARFCRHNADCTHRHVSGNSRRTHVRHLSF